MNASLGVFVLVPSEPVAKAVAYTQHELLRLEQNREPTRAWQLTGEVVVA